MAIQELLGKTLTRIVCGKDNDVLFFQSSCGQVYSMHHHPQCCENVEIEDICGDLDDLINSPLTLAEVVENHDNPREDCQSFTWTFYKLGTMKGTVTIRWWGESNGYYSESVDFEALPRDVSTGFSKAIEELDQHTGGRWTRRP